MSSRVNHQPTKRERREAMARKREDRAVRAAHKKEQKAQSYLADDLNFVSFAQQLASMGLKLRDIPGDGNCLFRSLGDQVDGNSKNHLKHREDVVKYMLENRADFEPFVEDDIPFDRHVANLKKTGTYAGNDAIVAFARLNQLTVVIHQLNSPLWQIHGNDDQNAKQIHISYHNGDHYSSVRKCSDVTSNPTSIRLKADGTVENGVVGNNNIKSAGNSSSYSNSFSNNSDYSNHISSNGASKYNVYQSDNGEFSWATDNYENVSSQDNYTSQQKSDGIARAMRDEESIIYQISHETGCDDLQLISESYFENGCDIGETVVYITQIMETQIPYTGQKMTSSQDSGIWSESGTGSRIFGSGTKPKKQLNAKQMKQQKKIDKKNRAMERHKQKILGNHSEDSGYHANKDSSDDETVIVKNVGALTI